MVPQRLMVNKHFKKEDTMQRPGGLVLCKPCMFRSQVCLPPQPIRENLAVEDHFQIGRNFPNLDAFQARRADQLKHCCLAAKNPKSYLIPLARMSCELPARCFLHPRRILKLNDIRLLWSWPTMWHRSVGRHMLCIQRWLILVSPYFIFN